MIATAGSLLPRVIVAQALCTVATATLVALMAPWLLQMQGDAAAGASWVLFVGLLLGGSVGLLRSWWRVHRHRFTLRALSLGSRAFEPFELGELLAEDRDLTIAWGFPAALGLPTAMLVWRPAALDLAAGISLTLLGAVFVAAAALPLHLVIRSTLTRAFDLAPTAAMAEFVAPVGKSGEAILRLRRRLLVAVVTPVVFVTIGAALITSAHLRRADEQQREETARALARAALEPRPALVAGAGLDKARRAAAALGFEADSRDASGQYRLERSGAGVARLSTPLDDGSATVRFVASTVDVVSREALLVALLAVLGAASLAVLVARALSEDLVNATRGLRVLDTDSVLRGSRERGRGTRFRAVAELAEAIELLAERFRVFARAQERTIDAREAVTRTRGLFFASVSHDLKSPLNAILGFTALVRRDAAITEGQGESLALIESRGRELLALIETILDAARVEAGQLTLVLEPFGVEELVADAIEKGKDLGGGRLVEVIGEVADDLPLALVDRVRFARALATFIGHAARSGSGDHALLRALRGARGGLTLEVEVPSRGYPASRLRALFRPENRPGTAEHRGLALALGLARSIVELHTGHLEVEERHGERVCFRVELPRAATLEPQEGPRPLAEPAAPVQREPRGGQRESTPRRPVQRVTTTKLPR